MSGVVNDETQAAKRVNNNKIKNKNRNSNLIEDQDSDSEEDDGNNPNGVESENDNTEVNESLPSVQPNRRVAVRVVRSRN